MYFTVPVPRAAALFSFCLKKKILKCQSFKWQYISVRDHRPFVSIVSGPHELRRFISMAHDAAASFNGLEVVARNIKITLATALDGKRRHRRGVRVEEICGGQSTDGGGVDCEELVVNVMEGHQRTKRASSYVPHGSGLLLLRGKGSALRLPADPWAAF